MVRRRTIEWRTMLVIGTFACCGALAPDVSMAQQPAAPSGAAVQTGGITLSRPAGGAQVVLPNTGGGPAADESDVPLVPIVAALAGLGAVAYLRHRATRNQVRG